MSILEPFVQKLRYIFPGILRILGGRIHLRSFVLSDVFAELRNRIFYWDLWWMLNLLVNEHDIVILLLFTKTYFHVQQLFSTFQVGHTHEVVHGRFLDCPEKLIKFLGCRNLLFCYHVSFIYTNKNEDLWSESALSETK